MSISIGSEITHGDEVWKVDYLIAEGRFGIVFHATRTAPTPGEAAIKIPTAEILKDPIWSRKFRREAGIVANLSHPNVVKILEVWEFPDGEVALVQEFIKDRRTLSKYFADPANERVTAVLQTLYALRATHEKGVVHRDVGPQNILVDLNGNVRIIDFGLAKQDPRRTQVLTEPGAWFGTEGCVAPEQMADSANVDGRADLFGLGRTLAAALQQRHPTHVEIDALPPPWDNVCFQFVHYDRDKRPADANAAIGLVFRETVKAGYAPADLYPHAQEALGSLVEPDGWPAFCNFYFSERIRRGLLDRADLRTAAVLRATVFAHEDFDADQLFDAFETGAVGDYFRSGMSPFEAVDPLGDYLTATYLDLSAENKIRCFRRLVASAVRYHRYQLMGQVRMVYRMEPSADIKAQLLAVLNEEDPDHVIEGRSAIPREVV